MTALTRLIAPGVIEIDTLLGGYEQMTAGYLLVADRPFLIETGAQSSVPALFEALSALGVGGEDLAGVAVTHIHLDHAGGVGDVAAAFSNAKVYVHELGARHLVDPSRLVASAALVYGELLDSLYGRLEPTPVERLVVLGDGERVELGSGRYLEAIDSPGHAKHHLGFFDSQSGLLFSGDAAGVKLPGMAVLRPATPPPDFDLDLALCSLQKFAAREPAGIALAHYGLVPGTPSELLGEANEALQRWADVARTADATGADIEQALVEHFSKDLEAESRADRERIELLNGIHSNALGLSRWLAMKGDPRHQH